MTASLGAFPPAHSSPSCSLPPALIWRDSGSKLWPTVLPRLTNACLALSDERMRERARHEQCSSAPNRRAEPRRASLEPSSLIGLTPSQTRGPATRRLVELASPNHFHTYEYTLLHRGRVRARTVPRSRLGVTTHCLKARRKAGVAGHIPGGRGCAKGRTLKRFSTSYRKQQP
jgi:hypothetical protein